MAATKRSIEIRARKDEITQQINAVTDSLRSARFDRIPQSVVNGSFQYAVEFKALIDRCVATPPCPTTVTLKRLEEILSDRNAILKKINQYN